MEMSKQINWDVKIEKRKYGPGEKVSVTGTFRSEANVPHIWTVHTQFIQMEGEDFPTTIVPDTIELKPSEEREVVIRELTVTDELPPGEYYARVGLETERGVVDLKEIAFTIEGTPKPYEFRIILSRDRSGNDASKVFTSEDKEIYIHVASDIKTLTLSGTCTDPGGREATLGFEGMVSSYPLSIEGLYNLKVTARAEGYRSITKHVAFNVIKDKPVFGTMSSADKR